MKRLLTTFKEKWPEYLLEIFVLIIGIYGAFALESWNDERNEKKLEFKYLRNIRTDLELNLKSLNTMVENRKISISASDSILAVFNGYETLNADAFNRYALTVMVWYPFEQHDNTYRELLNSGNLSIISSSAIKHHLQNMQTRFKRVGFIENEMQQDYERYLYDPFFTTTDLERSLLNYDAQMSGLDRTASLEQSQVDKLISNQAFKNGFVLSAFNSQDLVSEYDSIVDTTMQLIALITLQLEK
jgi:uncharacterized membrane protein